MLTKKEQIIKLAQDKAKELGHCLCNLKLECPCTAYTKAGICRCSEHYVEKTISGKIFKKTKNNE